MWDVLVSGVSSVNQQLIAHCTELRQVVPAPGRKPWMVVAGPMQVALDARESMGNGMARYVIGGHCTRSRTLDHGPFETQTQTLDAPTTGPPGEGVDTVGRKGSSF